MTDFDILYDYLNSAVLCVFLSDKPHEKLYTNTVSPLHHRAQIYIHLFDFPIKIKLWWNDTLRTCEGSFSRPHYTS